jgi:hypothetical protein
VQPAVRFVEIPEFTTLVLQPLAATHDDAPELHRMSGITSMPFIRIIVSPSELVGPVAGEFRHGRFLTPTHLSPHRKIFSVN